MTIQQPANWTPGGGITPVYQAQTPATAQPSNLPALADASTALAWMSQDDMTDNSMNDFGGGDSVPSIRMNEMGWLVKRINGVDSPPVQSLDVVIVGVGPRGGGVYRMFYNQQYNKDIQGQPPVCVSFDGVHPSKSSSLMQAMACAQCPQNVKGTAPNNGKACKHAAYFAVVDVNDPTTIYRLRLSATPLFNKDPDPNGFFTVPTYKPYLQRLGANWEQVITNLSCPYGKNGGFRFRPVSYINQEIFQTIKGLKEMISLNLIVDLNAAMQQEQLQLSVNGQHVAQIPVTQLPAHPAQTVAPVVQHAPQAPVAPQPPVQPTPAPVAPQPVVDLKTQWANDPRLPAEVRTWVANPAVTEQQAHDYLATNFAMVLAPQAPVAPQPPVQPTPAPVAPQPVAPVAPSVAEMPPAPAEPVGTGAAQVPPAMSAPAQPVAPQNSNTATVDAVIDDLLGGSDLNALG